MTESSLSPRARAFVWLVVAAGTGMLVYSAAHLGKTEGAEWLIFVALTLLSGSLSIKVPSVPVSVSLSEAFIVASALLFGPGPAIITVALDGLIVSLWSRRRSFHRTLFNIAEPAISVGVAAHLFYALWGGPPLIHQPIAFAPLVFPLLAFIAVYFSLNGLLMAVAVHLETGESLLQFFREHALHVGLNYVGSLAIAIVLVQNSEQINFMTIVVLAPLVALSYFSSRTSMARVDDAHRHLAELNALYLSTVETLALAIDAKDQVTHGHIRRVQARALELARSLGVTDVADLKALEAAALLHDLGKLAIPEHILNKPGKLAPVEIEQMKMHSSIGASILSQINFPYPVAPIVRHHHENWDGSGYPDRLVGEAIPIGARILAVVDCFDALTSDRPYRRGLTDRAAAGILRARRGTMYDAKVVDAFLDMLNTFVAQEATDPEGQTNPLTDVVRLPMVRPDATAEGVEASFERLQVPVEAWRWRTVESRAIVVASVLMRRFEDVCHAVFMHDEATGSLVPVSMWKGAPRRFTEETIALGTRLSGWVAANRRTIINSDPALDLGDLGDALVPRLQSTLCAPLVVDNTLAGVVALYSAEVQRFSPDDVRTVEVASPLLASILLGREPRQTSRTCVSESEDDLQTSARRS